MRVVKIMETESWLLRAEVGEIGGRGYILMGVGF